MFCFSVETKKKKNRVIDSLSSLRVYGIHIIVYVKNNPRFRKILPFYNEICLLQQDCPNGKLTPAKFVDMYKMFFPSGNAEEFCDHVFRTFDMDKNGYIDFKVSILSNRASLTNRKRIS